ncbi:50S ribosomal protein L11 methyltransferase [Leptospira mtsangambouensis]|uniref:50S ribosomal protein L11 methyltransferase n=1 Tax=Leptospira mtsangambouensis TaxID=2484912 RepID=UPI001EEC018A|nr:50S ribosomal protein L11 methyltransferase [Leptospira mtsangambouensis]MCG6142562.1 50S ribosomal protein L11 methyltransferase [Leptospira mtsangambouensis]
MEYRELKVNLPKELSDSFYELLDTLQCAGYYEILFDGEAPKEKDQGLIRDNTNIRIYLQTDEIDKELKILIFLKINAPDNSNAESRNIETRDYEEAYKEYYKPFPIGKKLWVIPTWEKNEPETVKLWKPNGGIPLFINPGVAFGTGHHETTKLILEYLDELYDKGEFQFQSACDVGTGSGILSIGLAKFGVSKIFALDIDPNAVKAAWSNWTENEYPKGFQFSVEESGIDNPKLSNTKYDLAIANITFAVLSQNIRHLAKIEAPRIIFSGIITEKKDQFLSLLQSHLPGKLLYSKEWNEWWVLDWVRN